MRFGSYEVTEKPLGQGAMGVVYKARHAVLGTTACIKVLQPKYTQHADVARRFINEGVAAASLENEHIVGVLDCAQTPEGTWYIVLDYIRGVSLGRWLRTPKAGEAAPDLHGVAPRRLVPDGSGAVDLVQTLQVLLQVADALHAAHDAGIVHRDVKPDNIMLTARPGNALHAIVVDFGIAKLRSPDGVDLTRSTAYLGTPAYMAPEQFGSAKYVNRRTDVYALGGILYKLLTGGFYAWADANNEIQSTEQLYHRQVTEPPPDPRVRNPAITPALAELVRWSLICDPATRCPSALAFAQSLASAMLEGGVASAEVARAWMLVPALQQAASGAMRPATGGDRASATDDVLWRPPTTAVSRGVPSEIVARPEEATRQLRPPPPEIHETTLSSAAGQPVGTPVMPAAVAAAPPPSLAPAAGGVRRRWLAAGLAALAAILVVAAFALPRSGGRQPSVQERATTERNTATAAGGSASQSTTAAGSDRAPLRSAADTSPPAAVALDAAPVAPAVDAGPRTVRVAILTEPTGAAVFVDDQLVGPAPVTATIAVGHDAQLRAELPGHVTTDRRYVADERDGTVHMTLPPAAPNRTGARRHLPRPGADTHDLDRIAD